MGVMSTGVMSTAVMTTGVVVCRGVPWLHAWGSSVLCSTFRVRTCSVRTRSYLCQLCCMSMMRTGPDLPLISHAASPDYAQPTTGARTRMRARARLRIPVVMGKRMGGRELRRTSS